MKKTILLLTLLAVCWTGFGSWYWSCKVKNDCSTLFANNDVPAIVESETKPYVYKKSSFPEKYLKQGANIYFDTGKSELRADGFKTLNDLVDNLKKNESVVIDLNGHADITGDIRFNEILSKKRAETVRQYLHYMGIEDCRFAVEGFGASIPNSSNDTPEGRQLNRRVELRFQD